VEVLEVLPFNQTLTIGLEGGRVTLGYPAARYIFAERLKTGLSPA
jgi:hypothetical protein